MKRAFTMIELLVVIGIIGILVAVLLGAFSGSSDSARAAKCQANMHNLAMAVQSYGMASGLYPRASKHVYNRGKNTIQGWIGDDLSNPYEGSETVRKACLTNGLLWSSIKGNRDVYLCPHHQKYAQDKGKKTNPLWSYAMSTYFDSGSGLTRQRKYDGISRTDRFLLFAELPYAKMKLGSDEIQSEASGAALDPALDYEAGEVIGFNHKSGKRLVGHVCFVDGHVEKLVPPKSKDNIRELTEWICCPAEFRSGKKVTDFDVVFDSKESKYIKVKDEE